MIKCCIIQDTIKQEIPVRQDTIKQLPDSSLHNNDRSPDSGVHVNKVHIQLVENIRNTDTASVCIRNSIADVTFYDSTNVVTRIDKNHLQDFPFIFTGISRKIAEEKNADIVRHLRNGDELPSGFFHNDWGLPVILLTIFIYGVIKTESLRFLKGILKFISLRGINDSASRDISALFQWQSTLFNLASFINISLFAFLTTLWYDILPFEGNRFIYWLISFVTVISAITLRHFICIIIGNMSGEKEIFREYLIGIYRAYRLAGVLLLVIIVLILYTIFMPVKFLFYAGFALVALLYFIRVFRLFLIFINRHVSIFYLILYLCALEILPVVIIIKYVTGLI
jgi:hypothetical protein